MNKLSRCMNPVVRRSSYNISQCYSNTSGQSGDISKAGGTFSRKERALEDHYMRQREKEEIKKYREELLAGAEKLKLKKKSDEATEPSVEKK